MQEENIVVILDFGSSKISLTVADISSGSPEAILFHKQAPAVGINRGQISNPRNVSQILGKLVAEAQEELGIVIHRAIVNFPRWKVHTKELSISLDRTSPDEYINEEELQTLRDMAVSKMIDEMDSSNVICATVAKSYSTEELLNVQEEDILGAIGARICGNFLMFLGPKNAKTNIDKVMNELKIDVFSYEFTPVIESPFVLSAEEKMQGVALIEIGAGISSVSIYNNGSLRFFKSFPFGGKQVSSDIQMECNVSQTLAENIKLAWAYCMPDKLQNMSDKILKIEDPIGNSTQEVTLKYLSEVVNCRMKEILNACFYLIKESGYDDKLRQGIVLTGGGAQIHCLQSMVSALSGLNCRIACPHYFEEASDCAVEAMLLNASNLKRIMFVSPMQEEQSDQIEQTREPNPGELFDEEQMSDGVKHIVKEKPDPKNKKEKGGGLKGFFASITDSVMTSYQHFGEDDNKDNKEK